MRLSSLVISAAAFIAAAAFCLITAGFAVRVIEDSSKRGVREELAAAGMTWSTVDANGLQVFLAGTAPTEAERFKALSTAGRVVDAARVIDQMNVTDIAAMAPPRFSIEMLRNDSGINLIGLVPTQMDREDFSERLTKTATGEHVTDLLESADYPAPENWDAVMRFAMTALGKLPRSKISADAERVEITAMADSAEKKRAIEQELTRDAPEGITLELAISAPRPVITPYTLRFQIDGEAAKFDACSAPNDTARQRILAAAKAAGMQGDGSCRIGLGVPSTQWAAAVEMTIAALKDLGGGTITFSDADISLIALEGTAQGRFDEVIGRLETSLPEVFALHSELPQATNEAEGPPEFVATLSPEGQVQIRGRVNSEVSRQAVDSFAKARFNSDVVTTSARVDETLPATWALRVLTGLETLKHLSNGAVIVTPDDISVSGQTGYPDASDEIAGFLSDKLGEGARFEVDVTYKETLDPVLNLPTPEDCEARVTSILAERKINFEPGSATLDAAAAAILDDIAEALEDCQEIEMEIAGYTDSQGREEMNLSLSRERAFAVLDAMRSRSVRNVGFTAEGYGEADPVANNETEEGREANRRIEFRLIRPAPMEAAGETTLESLEQDVPAEGEGDDAPEPDADTAADGATDETSETTE